MLGIAVNQVPKLLRVAKRRQRPVNQANDFAEPDLGGCPTQLVPALGAAHAVHDAGILQLQQDQLQEFFRKPFLVGNITDADGALVIPAGQHHQGLESIQAFL